MYREGKKERRERAPLMIRPSLLVLLFLDCFLRLGSNRLNKILLLLRKIERKFWNPKEALPGIPKTKKSLTCLTYVPK